jgi:hypothetical protein
MLDLKELLKCASISSSALKIFEFPFQSRVSPLLGIDPRRSLRSYGHTTTSTWSGVTLSSFDGSDAYGADIYKTSFEVALQRRRNICAVFCS